VTESNSSKPWFSFLIFPIRGEKEQKELQETFKTTTKELK